MTHPSEWRKFLATKGVSSDFGIDAITVEKEEKDGEIRFIYTFPEPKKAPNCYYSILVIDKNKEWRYFTLEKDNKLFPCPDILIDSLALVCGQKGYNHLQYSRWSKNELNDFKRNVQDILDNKPYNQYEEGLKFLDKEKIVKMQAEIKLCELLGIEDEYYEENCSIF